VQRAASRLCRTVLALLRVVDEAPEVARREWEERWKEEGARLLSLRAKAREIEVGLAAEPELVGELGDVNRKLRVYEESGHADILKAYQKRRRQGRAVDAWEESWGDAGDRLRRLARELAPIALDASSLDAELPADRLPPEALDRLDLWFPEDALDVQHSRADQERRFRPITEGSPGEKTAALLAFLLSYGEEPLILDQPEDDLDNHLIYGLIVNQLRDVKRRRQVIVVTHNANIAVNGDAEQVLALAARGGQTQTECAGSLQERETRATICAVMEGGREAFEQRYRRLVLED